MPYIKKLKSAGLAEQQAEEQSEAPKDLLCEVLDSTLATKADIEKSKCSFASLLPPHKKESSAGLTPCPDIILDLEELDVGSSVQKILKFLDSKKTHTPYVGYMH